MKSFIHVVPSVNLRYVELKIPYEKEIKKKKKERKEKGYSQTFLLCIAEKRL